MRTIAAAAAAIVVSVSAFAADYPTGPIMPIVPYLAGGGGNDVIARLVAAKTCASLGKTIVIENRGSAGNIIGTRDAAWIGVTVE